MDEETYFRHQLPALLRGELSDEQEQAIFAALDASPALRRELNELSETSELVETHAAELENEASQRETAAQIAPTPQPKAWTRHRLITGIGAATIAAAAAIAIIIAVGPRNEQQPVTSAVSLTTVDEGTAQGTAHTDNQSGHEVLIIEANELAPPPSGYYYEAWMLSSADGVPISAGVMTESGGEWVLPNLSSDYTIVDVSVEPIDGGPEHSGISVMRGSGV